jgi:hypothetical protein
MRGMKIGAMAIAALAAGASAQNLMSNGSFEQTGPGFILFQNWDNFNNVFLDASVELTAQDGVNSAKMFGQFGGEQSDQVLLQTVTGITEGQQYSLSAYAQHLSTDAVQAGNLVLLQLNFQDSAGNGVPGGQVQAEAIVPGSTPTDQWLQTVVTGTAPAGATQILVALLHLQLDGAAPGATFWDNVELVEGDVVLPCEGDFNGDGLLNFFDFVDFINAFNAGCP